MHGWPLCSLGAGAKYWISHCWYVPEFNYRSWQFCTLNKEFKCPKYKTVSTLHTPHSFYELHPFQILYILCILYIMIIIIFANNNNNNFSLFSFVGRTRGYPALFIEASRHSGEFIASNLWYIYYTPTWTPVRALQSNPIPLNLGFTLPTLPRLGRFTSHNESRRHNWRIVFTVYIFPPWVATFL